MGFIMRLRMRRVEEEGPVALCSSDSTALGSRCADGGCNPVWFHFKRSGRGTWPVKSLYQVLLHRSVHVCASVCVCAHTSDGTAFMIKHFNMHVMRACVYFGEVSWLDLSPCG